MVCDARATLKRPMTMEEFFEHVRFLPISRCHLNVDCNAQAINTQITRWFIK